MTCSKIFVLWIAGLFILFASISFPMASSIFVVISSTYRSNPRSSLYKRVPESVASPTAVGITHVILLAGPLSLASLTDRFDARIQCPLPRCITP